ncbi:2-dehydropantoate 2-reductase [Brevundimonas sp.]|uniref:ketopantoate reductase family protein n=1 Tax=Brevundimonas sp. TaxID=1871086 RepID=UPI00289E085C|nr:2-dehydropantoate 2-reductase [Brevundimonas sp.]
MRVCIFGAGAIGGFIGAHLARRGDIALSCVARGDHLQAIQANGLTVETEDETFSVGVRASDNPEYLGPQDYVFLTVKQQQLVDVADRVQPLLGPDTVVLPPTTGIPYWYGFGAPKLAEARLEGLDPTGRLSALLPPERVIGCVYFVAATVVGPGRIRQDGGRPRFPLGEPDGSKSSRVRALSEAMQGAGLRAPVEGNIRDWLWLKMISSLCWNTSAVLTRATLDEMLAHPPTMKVVRALMTEAFAIAEGCHAQVAGTPDSLIEGARRSGGHKMSMLEDFEAGRPLELSPLLNSVEVMSRAAGVETPMIDSLLSLTRMAEISRDRDGA